MAQLFPKTHVIGFISSIVLTLLALTVLVLDVSFTAKMVILFVTAILQACLQLFLFMHIGESEDKKELYINVAFAALIGIITIVGPLLVMVWDM